MKGNLDRLSHWLKENKITEVECLISDLSGIARGKISPTNKKAKCECFVSVLKGEL